MKAYRLLFVVLSLLLILFGLGSAVLLVVEPFIPNGVAGLLLAFLLSQRMVMTGVLTVALIGFGLWALTRRSPDGTETRDPRVLLAGQKRRMAIVFALFLIGSIAIAVQYMRDLREAADEQGAKLVSDIVALKVQQVDKWLLDRTLEAQYLASSLESFSGPALREDPEARAISEVILSEALAARHDRAAILLMDADGKAMTTAGPQELVADVMKRLDTSVYQRRQLTIVDPEGGASENARYQYFVAPIGTRSGANGPLAVAVIVVDGQRELLPQLRAWPSPSNSGEVLIVKRTGDSAVHVIAPDSKHGRHPPDRIDLSDRQLPAVAALHDGDGFRIARDLLGHEVLSASRRAQQLNWVVVAKIDRNEVRSSASGRIYSLVVVVILANAISALLMFVVWRSQRADIAQVQSGWERERQAADEHHRQMFSTMQEIAFLIDKDNRVIDANPAAERAYGYTLEEFRKLKVADLRTPAERNKVSAQWPVGAQGSVGVTYETVHQRKDGSQFPVEILNHTYVDERGTTYWRGFIRDLTARKRLEERILRLSRIRKTMFDATESVLRARSEGELMVDICATVSRIEGYRLAAIHCAAQDVEKTVRLVTQAGEAKHYLESIMLSWSDDTPLGRGPTGTALRTGEIQVNQDFAKNFAVAPWRERAEQNGLHASIALPLRIDGAVEFVLTLYAAEPDAFDFEEVELLRHLADDAAYGIAALRRKEAMEALMRRQRGIWEALSAAQTATSEHELFQTVCAIIVDKAGYALAGVGTVEMDEAQTVRFVAGAGARAVDVAGVRVSWGENEYGNGPVGRAVRSKQTQVSRRRSVDPSLAPWRSMLDSLGLKIEATIALPLVADGEVFAVLAVYSSDENPFSADELAMLGAFANDLSLGVAALRLRASRQ